VRDSHALSGSYIIWFNKTMGELGRTLILVGGLLLVFGIIFILAGKVNLPMGRLPGDIVCRGKNTTFYFPLATSILLSVILSLVLYVVNRMRR
jgi:Protein of unknown function (DUF2905)